MKNLTALNAKSVAHKHSKSKNKGVCARAASTFRMFAAGFIVITSGAAANAAKPGLYTTAAAYPTDILFINASGSVTLEDTRMVIPINTAISYPTECRFKQ